MKKPVSRLLAVIDKISYFGGHIPGVLFVAAIVVLITLEVILRYVFNTSTLLADEFSAYLFVGLLYFGASYTLRTHRHITISVVVTRLRPGVQHFLSRFVTVLNLPVFILLSWRGYHLVWHIYQHSAQAATVMATPLYLPMLVIPLGLTMLALQAVAEVVRLFVAPERAQTASEE